MSVLRQLNILGQMRLDVPHIRSIESSIAADFDVVAGRVQAGEKAVVVRGFTLANFDAGTAANSVQLTTADGILYNMNASESGTFLWVSADRDVETLNSATNARVSGSFTAGQVNYVGLDLTRSADSTTADLVQFLDPNTLLENAKNVPLGRTLDYRIVISTTPFSSSPNLVPIAKIKTDAANNVDAATGSVQDARNILWRLGSGGDFPNRFSTFTWAQNRVESITGSGVFTGGDKAIQSQKDWMDAVMTRLWEIGGGENWYSTTADRNVRMVRAPSTVFASTGDNFEWVITGLYVSGTYPRHLHWQGLKIVFDNSNTAAVYYNTVTDQAGDDAAGSAAASKTALADGDCIYVDIDRTSNAAVVAKKAALQTLSVPAIPGSRIVLAWRVGADVFTRDSSLAVNVSFQPATTTVAGAVRLNETPNATHAASGVPTVPVLNLTNSITVGGVTYPITGSATAITGTGGPTSGVGVAGIGGTTNGVGVTGLGTGNAAGGTFTGGADGRGLNAFGLGTAFGINVTAAGAAAINAQSNGGNGAGIIALGNGSGPGANLGNVGTGPALIMAATSVTYGATLAQVGVGGGLFITTSGAAAPGIVVQMTTSSQPGISISHVTGNGNGINASAGTSTFGTGMGGNFTGGGSHGIQATSGAGALATVAGVNAIGLASTGSYGIRTVGGDLNAFVSTNDAAFTPGYGCGICAVGGQVYGGVGVAGYGGGTSVTHTPGASGADGQGGYFVGVASNAGIGAGGGDGLLAKGGLTFATSGGLGGGGVTGYGGFGNGSSTGGWGGRFQGGSSASGVGGIGVIGIGASNSAGGSFAGAGTGHGIVVSSSTGKAMSITTNTNISYTSGRTMKKILGGGSFKALVSADNQLDRIFYEGPYLSTNTIGLGGPGVTTQLTLYTDFTLPQNAVITQVRIAMRHSGASGGVNCNIALQKATRSDTILSSPFGWASTPVLTVGGGGVNLGLSASATGEIFSPTVNGTPANRTVSSLDDVFALELNSNVPASSGYIYITWVEITYTMFDTLVN